MKEEFKEIEGFPNYQISNYGNVKNVKKNRYKVPGTDKKGYLKVDLYKNSKRTTKKIHRLVATAFLKKENDSKRNDINHIDGNKHNNNVTNLEWCTKSENMQHAFKNHLVHIEGRRPSYGMLGKKNPNGGAQKRVRVIENNKEYKSIAACSRDLNLSDRSIVDCLKGRQKSHRGYHFEYI